VNVVLDEGLVSIDCNNASLASVFESIERATGVELILEDEVKSKRLTANLNAVPLAMAIQRLLEGTGVNYIVMMDPADWGRVAKVFLGGGGGGPARSAAAPRYEPPEPVEEEVYEDPMDSMDMSGMDQGFESPDLGEVPPEMEAPPDNVEDFGQGFDQENFNPPGSSPIPDFLPPAQSFPRSNFTPGLPGTTRRQQGGFHQPQQGQNPGDPAAPPPATFPFTDPFGRPIPIPPGMNQQQQQDGQQQNRRPQQQ
jgi:hypothetical protein